MGQKDAVASTWSAGPVAPASTWTNCAGTPPTTGWEECGGPPAPAITDVSPSQGTTATTVSVTITGIAFTFDSVVTVV